MGVPAVGEPAAAAAARARADGREAVPAVKGVRGPAVGGGADCDTYG